MLHHTEYINRLIETGRLKLRKDDRKVAYHDPCELGRGCGIYDQPREALSRVADLVSAEKQREESICCGGSIGSLTLTWDERSAISAKSLDNLMYSHPDANTSDCPATWH